MVLLSKYKGRLADQKKTESLPSTKGVRVITVNIRREGSHEYKRSRMVTSHPARGAQSPFDESVRGSSGFSLNSTAKYLGP